MEVVVSFYDSQSSFAEQLSIQYTLYWHTYARSRVCYLIPFSIVGDSSEERLFCTIGIIIIIITMAVELEKVGEMYYSPLCIKIGDGNNKKRKKRNPAT